MEKRSRLWVNHAEAVVYITLILVVIGTVNIFSASFVLAGQMLNDSYYFLKRHLMMFTIGIMATFFFSRFDYHRLQNWASPLFFITLGLLAAVHFIGVEVNGARRWLYLGFQFQPSELAKLSALIVTAVYLGPLIDRGRKITLWSTPFFLSAALGAVVLKQPDMGTSVIIVGVCLTLYLIAGLPKGQMLLLFGGGLTGLAYTAMAAAYRADRIAAWLNPWAYQQSIGYQTVQGLIAIGSGGFFGTGLGMGASKFHYLPEAHTDFAFAVLCQEWGFIGALTVLFFMGLLGYYGMRVAMKAPDGMGRMLAVGAVALVVGQGAINIGMVSGALPVVGVPLPFVSFGGTSLIVNLTAIGILINVARRSAVKTPQPTETVPEAPYQTPRPGGRPNRSLNRLK